MHLGTCDDGQFDARFLDLDCRRRSVRGRRDRRVPLREKSVEADRKTQRLEVTAPGRRWKLLCRRPPGVRNAPDQNFDSDEIFLDLLAGVLLALEPACHPTAA